LRLGARHRSLPRPKVQPRLHLSTAASGGSAPDRAGAAPPARARPFARRTRALKPELFVPAFAGGLVRRVLGFHPIILLEPAAEIDVGAALGAERTMARRNRFAADRAGSAGRDRDDGIMRHGSGYRFTAPRCQNRFGPRLRRSRSDGRAAVRDRAARRLPQRIRPRRLAVTLAASNSLPVARAPRAAAGEALHAQAPAVVCARRCHRPVRARLPPERGCGAGAPVRDVRAGSSRAPAAPSGRLGTPPPAPS